MNAKKLVTGLTWRGQVEGKRQTYTIFEGSGFYFVLSFSRAKENAGNFNVVDAEAVEYVRSRFAGTRGVTANDVYDKAKRTKHISSALYALNVLYVLSALGQASIDNRPNSMKLYFNVRK